LPTHKNQKSVNSFAHWSFPPLNYLNCSALQCTAAGLFSHLHQSATPFVSLPMPFPQTPNTILGRLKHDTMPRTWETAWEEFFDLYHYPVRVCVRGAFQRHNWTATTEHDLSDVVMSVFESLFRGQDSFVLDPGRGRFRQFLTTLCQRRVVDFIRRHKHRGRHDSLESLAAQGADLATIAAPATESEAERQGFDTAAWGALLAALREHVSPQTYMIFELVKLAGHSPADVARQLGVKRGVIDNSIYKALQTLRTLAATPEFADEFKN
jgi:RNA polymerase sigma factor (sigma-70 family)